MSYKQVSIITKRWKNFKPPVGNTINWAHPLAKNIVGCWLMNEGGGNIVKSFNHTYTNNGCSWLSGKDGICLLGNGTSNKLTLTQGIIGAQFSNKLTLITSFYCSNSPTTEEYIFAKWDAVVGGRSFRLELGATPALGFIISPDGTANSGFCRGATTLSPTTWYQSSVVYNGVDIRIYKNGILDTNGANNPKAYTGIIYNSTAPNYQFCGGSAATPATFFDGKICYTFLYNRVLSPSEIQQLYQEPYCFIAPQRRRFFIQVVAPPVSTSRPRRRVILSCS